VLIAIKGLTGIANAGARPLWDVPQPTGLQRLNKCPRRPALAVCWLREPKQSSAWLAWLELGLPHSTYRPMYDRLQNNDLLHSLDRAYSRSSAEAEARHDLKVSLRRNTRRIADVLRVLPLIWSSGSARVVMPRGRDMGCFFGANPVAHLRLDTGGQYGVLFGLVAGTLESARALSSIRPSCNGLLDPSIRRSNDAQACITGASWLIASIDLGSRRHIRRLLILARCGAHPIKSAACDAEDVKLPHPSCSPTCQKQKDSFSESRGTRQDFHRCSRTSPMIALTKIGK
jgi:hypothetical protein